MDMKKKEKDVDTKIDELARMVASGFTDVHSEIHELRDEFKADMKFLRGDIDIMLDRHIGTFRKDYDELAARVTYTAAGNYTATLTDTTDNKGTGGPYPIISTATITVTSVLK